MSAAASDLGVGLGVGTYNTSGRNAFRPITTVKFRTRTRMDSKEKKMTKTYRTVLKSSLVMLVLFAVAGSGVAQAQECQARAETTEIVRAEGITEVVGDIQLQCRRATGDTGSFFDATIPPTLDITVRLNTNITNSLNDDRVVKLTAMVDMGYADGGITLVANQLIDINDMGTAGFAATNQSITDENFGNGELSEDGTTIEWTGIPTSMTDYNLDPDNDDIMDDGDINFDNDGNEQGFNLVISGIRVNASTIGDGEDIMANVLVGGTVVNSAPIKVADVTTGLEVKAEATEGLQCATVEATMGDDAMIATVTIQEGFKDAIISPPSLEADPLQGDSLVVTFLRIPAGVKVWVPAAVTVGMIDNPALDPPVDQEMILDPAAFSLELRYMGRTSGVAGGKLDDDNGMAEVEFNAAGTGEVIYDIGMTDGEVNEEWVKLPVVFTWEPEGDMPAVGGGDVLVSYNPTSIDGGDTFTNGGAKLPRFVESNDPVPVLEIDDCITTLLFPFVTNQAEFDTGMVISNTSEEAGSCTIDYSGADAPADLMTSSVEGGGQWIAILSKLARGFQGYITATCGFRGAHGFAFLANGYGVGDPTAAQSYLAVQLD